MTIIHDWDGERLGEGPVALFLHPATPETRPLVAAACTAEHGAVIRPDRLGKFLRAHADSCLVCGEAEVTHWVLLELLRAADDGDAEKVLWRFSREYRFHELVLFD